jgi:hypothetical protein
MAYLEAQPTSTSILAAVKQANIRQPEPKRQRTSRLIQSESEEEEEEEEEEEPPEIELDTEEDIEQAIKRSLGDQ